RLGPGRVAHPDPDQVIALDHRVAAHPETLRDVVLPRDLDALAARVELEAVVYATDVVAFAPAVRELGAAMAAAVVERDHAAAVAPVEDDRLLQQRARKQPTVDQLVIPGRDIPAVQQKGVGFRSHSRDDKSPAQRFSGGRARMAATKLSCAARSTGRCFAFVLAGY